METWKEKFDELKHLLPEVPDQRDNDTLRSKIFSIQCKLYDYYYGALVTKDEPKIIIKKDATPYQKSTFNENYTFLYQSLITGKQSQYIPYKERELLGITEDDKETGGIYPYALNLNDNAAIAIDYYRAVSNKIWNEYYHVYNQYLKEVDEIRGEWWDLYSYYIQSDEWISKREARKELDNYRCVICGSEEILQVHHLHYNNVGDENLKDLVTVCKSCHQKLHPYKKI